MRPMAVSSTACMPSFATLSAMPRKGTRAGSGKAARVSATISRPKRCAVPDGELQGDEGAEAVAEYGGVFRQLELVHDAGDVVGMIGDRMQDDRG